MICTFSFGGQWASGNLVPGTRQNFTTGRPGWGSRKRRKRKSVNIIKNRIWCHWKGGNSKQHLNGSQCLLRKGARQNRFELPEIFLRHLFWVLYWGKNHFKSYPSSIFPSFIGIEVHRMAVLDSFLSLFLGWWVHNLSVQTAKWCAISFFSSLFDDVNMWVSTVLSLSVCLKLEFFQLPGFWFSLTALWNVY